MIGARYGRWRVAAIINAHPWPWAVLIDTKRRGVAARVSVHSLDSFNAD